MFPFPSCFIIPIKKAGPSLQEWSWKAVPFLLGAGGGCINYDQRIWHEKHVVINHGTSSTNVCFFGLPSSSDSTKNPCNVFGSTQKGWLSNYRQRGFIDKWRQVQIQISAEPKSEVQKILDQKLKLPSEKFLEIFPNQTGFTSLDEFSLVFSSIWKYKWSIIKNFTRVPEARSFQCFSNFSGIIFPYFPGAKISVRMTTIRT